MNKLEARKKLEDNNLSSSFVDYLDKYLNDKDYFEEAIQRLIDGEPIQYIVGNTNFYGYDFLVNKNVLIPRFETEELVENTLFLIKKIFKDRIVNILDIGCGSGVIGLTMKIKHPQSNVDLIDISKDALEVATINKNNLNVDANIYYSDIFSNVDNKYDVIISNPPYIKENEEIEQIVVDNEPHLALYGGVDGLDYYKRILDNVVKYLNDTFLIAFEIGYQQKEDIIELVNKSMKNVEIIAKKDLSGKDRMIFIKSMNKI